MRMMRVVTIAALMVATLAMTQEEEAQKPAGPVIGGVRVLPDKQGLEVTGRVCLAQGIVEFLSVIAGGREYESALALDCQPSVLHAALLAMGARPGPTPDYLKWLAQEHPEEMKNAPAPGSTLLIDVEWTSEDGKTSRVPATSLLFNRKTKQVEPQTNEWIFVGSRFYKSADGQLIYSANINGVVLGLMPEDAVIQISHDAGNPYESPDEGFEVNAKLIPKTDTPVKLTIRLKPQEKKD